MYQLNEGLIIAVGILSVTGHVCIVGICLLLLTLYYLHRAPSLVLSPLE